jgi:type IV pilus assembly protein PilC
MASPMFTKDPPKQAPKPAQPGPAAPRTRYGRWKARRTSTAAASSVGGGLYTPSIEPVKVKGKSKGKNNRKGIKRAWYQFEITPDRIKPEALMNFSRQAASFVRAGIPLLDSLRVLREDDPKSHMSKVLADVEERLRSGSSFSEAMGAHESALPRYYLPMLRSAELTGALDDVLDQLAHYLDRDLEAKRKLKSALTYPVIVLMLSVVTVVILAAFVLPRFKDFFAEFDAELPLPTRMLLGMTGFVTAAWIPLTIGLVGGIVGLLVARQTSTGRAALDRFILRLPGIGRLWRYAIIERFCRLLAAMVEAGVPLPDALDVATASTNNAVFKRALAGARDEVIRGGGLSDPIGDTKLFPAAAQQMIRVGESTGTLDTQLKSSGSFFERELDYRLKRFTDMFEPVVILAVGFIVGFVAVALVSAMYGIYQSNGLS